MLSKITVRGLMSLRDVTLEPGPVTVLIGPNGAGKSNLLSTFEMLAHMSTGALGRYLVEHGPASTLLYYGPKQTPVLDFELTFAEEAGHAGYSARLGHAPGNDSFVYLSEEVSWLSDGRLVPMSFDLGAGHRESTIDAEFDGQRGTTTRNLRRLLRGISFFHFHDTSNRSALRTVSREADARYLRSDGSNLAAYLLCLSEGEAGSDAHGAWRRINHLVRRIVPSVAALKPARVGADAVRLDWQDDRGDLFGPNRLSDGCLRAIALITALAQPVESLPTFISIDEPELGMHPAALGVLAALIRSVSVHVQVLVATQSPTLLDLFEPHEIVVVERDDNASTLRRLDPERLSDWLDDYRLSDLYDLNLLGGRP